MIWKTRITQMTRTRYPIIMGAFMGLGLTEFAAAFSNAGGLGIITAMNYPKSEILKKELIKMKQLTDKPFGVNFSVIPELPQKRPGQLVRHGYQTKLSDPPDSFSRNIFLQMPLSK